MQRYHIRVVDTGLYRSAELEVEDMDDGDWVKYEDARAEIERLRAALREVQYRHDDHCYRIREGNEGPCPDWLPDNDSDWCCWCVADRALRGEDSDGSAR